MYEQYSEFKKAPYYNKAKRNKWMIEKMPKWLLRQIYPVARYLRFTNKKVLDIGSGAGLYSAMCRSWGNHVTEIEPHLPNAYGNPDVVKKSFAEYLPDRKFEIVMCFDVLEHITADELQPFFTKLQALLTADGHVLIKVPNASALAGIESHFGDLTHHRALNSLSLSDLLTKNNFTIDYINGVGPNLTFTRAAARLMSLPFALMLNIYLRSYGVSGEVHSPSIICRARVSK